MRFACLLIVLCSLAACAHEAENTGVQNSSVITLPAAYGMAMPAVQTSSSGTVSVLSVAEYSPVEAGRISRYQRQTIVPGGPDGDMDPCAKNFDAIMDHLEGLMTKQIEENNAIAAKQAAMPRYTF